MVMMVSSGCGCWCGSSWVSSLNILSNVLEDVLQSRLHECPSTLVLRLFLYPHDFSILVLLDLSGDIPEGEGTQLLDSADGDVILAFLGSCILDIVVDLAWAEENLPDFVISHDILVHVSNDSLESESLLELLDVWASVFKSEELLGRDHN
jgi:hypothetical protein